MGFDECMVVVDPTQASKKLGNDWPIFLWDCDKVMGLTLGPLAAEDHQIISIIVDAYGGRHILRRHVSPRHKGGG